MASQLRIYTINPGMMESWLKFFDENIRPIHAKLGMPVEHTWVNAEANEFVWVRRFRSIEEIQEQQQGYLDSPERKALGDTPRQYIAKGEIRVIEPVLAES